MQFPIFEHLKTTIKDYRKNKGYLTGGLAETAMVTAISGGSAGSVAAIVTTPVDVVKTRIVSPQIHVVLLPLLVALRHQCLGNS